jgi:hypothetical protein
MVSVHVFRTDYKHLYLVGAGLDKSRSRSPSTLDRIVLPTMKTPARTSPLTDRHIFVSFVLFTCTTMTGSWIADFHIYSRTFSIMILPCPEYLSYRLKPTASALTHFGLDSGVSYHDWPVCSSHRSPRNHSSSFLISLYTI